MDYDEPIRHGEAVARFLNDPTISSVFKEMDKQHYEAWKSAATVEDREALYQKARAIADLRSTLEAVVQAGELAKHNAARADRPA